MVVALRKSLRSSRRGLARRWRSPGLVLRGCDPPEVDVAWYVGAELSGVGFRSWCVVAVTLRKSLLLCTLGPGSSASVSPRAAVCLQPLLWAVARPFLLPMLAASPRLPRPVSSTFACCASTPVLTRRPAVAEGDVFRARRPLGDGV